MHVGQQRHLPTVQGQGAGNIYNNEIHGGALIAHETHTDPGLNQTSIEAGARHQEHRADWTEARNSHQRTGSLQATNNLTFKSRNPSVQVVSSSRQTINRQDRDAASLELSSNEAAQTKYGAFSKARNDSKVYHGQQPLAISNDVQDRSKDFQRRGYQLMMQNQTNTGTEVSGGQPQVVQTRIGAGRGRNASL